MMRVWLWSVLAVLLMVVAPSNAHQNMYCGKKDCYEILGLSTDSPQEEIRKAYKTLALKYHPDKNKGNEEEAGRIFLEVSTAYEVLKDPETRKEYDYATTHPEDFYGNQYRYYRYRYARQTNPYFVISGLLLFLTVFHYFYWWSRFLYIRKRLMENPAVKKRLLEIAAEKAAISAEDSTGKRKKDKKKLEDLAEEMDLLKEMDNVVNVRGWEGRKPTFRDLLIFQIPRIVYSFLYNIYWFLRWKIVFDILGHPYGPDERSYKTAEVLHVPWHQWVSIPDDRREELVARELWIPENMREYRRDFITSRKKTWR